MPPSRPELVPDTRQLRLLNQGPWTRSPVRLELGVSTEGWRFPSPPPELDRERPPSKLVPPPAGVPAPPLPDQSPAPAPNPVRLRPSADTVLMKDRLLCLLQPPLSGLFQGGGQLEVPFQPFGYQLEGIAFLMPRHHALLADEMGLGKTAQAILTLRLLFHTGQIRSALLVAPKPLIHNWGRELALWAPDLPFEVFPTDPDERRTAWRSSNCPLKLINYEAITRDAELFGQGGIYFDVVVLDEAQRIKNHDSKTAEAVRAIPRGRSWALTGTPIENHADDLINLFAFVSPGLVPDDTPMARLAQVTGGSILRRTKDDVLNDMPSKTVSDLVVDLSPAQRRAYDRAKNDGVVHLNELGETITLQHVFQLVMRLKQICNFDPLTGESTKLAQLESDLEEVAANGRKAIVFSQWVEPLQLLSAALERFGPLEYHGRVPQARRAAVLEQFRADPEAHVLLMTYGTGSVGLNLQFANYVYLFDRWWNPAVEDQAINRAHRIGQKYPVTVKRFLSSDTIEARIAAIIEQKRAMFLELLASSEKPENMGLTEDEIFGLFDLRRPRRG